VPNVTTEVERLTFSLRGAETGGEAGCWSVPLEAFVGRHCTNQPEENNTLAVAGSDARASWINNSKAW